jgi:hypothetical protein
MRFNLRKALLLLSIFCLGIALTGIVLAEDNQNGETYDAYPGAPISVAGQPTQTTLSTTTPGHNYCG